MKKIKIAVVGGGRVGNSHIQGIINSSGVAEIGGIVDLNKEVADQVSKLYDIPKFYTIEDALQDETIEAYIVCLPHYLHFPVGKKILKSKKHVLMEKPLGITIQEVKNLIKIAEENGVSIMSGQSRRYYLAIQQAKQSLDIIEGPTNLLYTFACTFTRESAPPWWQDNKKTGGLVLGMLGSHSIDMALWMFKEKRPVKLYCETRSISNVFEGDDAASIIITFEDGTIATNYLSISNSPLKHECLIEGKKGSIFFDHFGDHDDVVGAASTNLYINGNLQETKDDPDCFTVQATEFANSIIEGRESMSSAQNVFLTYVLIEAARISARTNSAVNLDEYLQSLNG